MELSILIFVCNPIHSQPHGKRETWKKLFFPTYYSQFQNVSVSSHHRILETYFMSK